ncbi:MAG TPA: FtsX-like permease family protein, partial [Steroidobacteraceae bacterium]|nr:FtsX-like permease family protein [Steroidobacteraceae bacterium]
MNTEIDFIVLSAAVLIPLSLVAGGVAIAGSVLYRSTLLKREVATRKVLGARRSHIARMFLSENVLGIAAGITFGGLTVFAASESQHAGFLGIVLSSAAILVVASLAGGW